MATQDLYRQMGGVVDSEFDGIRVDRFLATQYKFFSRHSWQKRLKSEELLVNGHPVRSSYCLKTGDRISMYHPQAREPDVDTGIYPIWKKGGVMAIFKPAPLPMHEVGPYRKNTFANLLRAEFGTEWAAVHRLDIETSGIVLCGNTHEIREKLAANFAEQKIAKTYFAIVHGIVQEDYWIDDRPIGDKKDCEIRIKKWVDAQGLPSRTIFKIIERGKHHSLIEAQPKTGRTNQIRIHCAASGHHLVGDKLRKLT